MLVTANIFQPLISVFASVIRFFHDSAGISWGLSIVLLTVCVRLVLLPLAVKQVRSMRRLQHLQPQMKAIQQKYKQDKQRQQEEMMKFYRENEVNPFASCLPLVAQLPVFISLFYMLRLNLRKYICGATQLKYEKHYALLHHTTLKAALGQTTGCGPHASGASFLFIHDITSAPTGINLIVLLLLYVGTQVASTLLMSAPTMDQTQRRLMLFMPVVFVVFIIRFPAGLILYWITTNTWTMAQQYAIKTLMGPMPAPVAAETATPPSQPEKRAETGGGLTGLLRGVGGGIGGGRRATPAPERVRSVGGPPPSSRKKKKRSGRRR